MRLLAICVYTAGAFGDVAPRRSPLGHAAAYHPQLRKLLGSLASSECPGHEQANLRLRPTYLRVRRSPVGCRAPISRRNTVLPFWQKVGRLANKSHSDLRPKCRQGWNRRPRYHEASAQRWVWPKVIFQAPTARRTTHFCRLSSRKPVRSRRCPSCVIHGERADRAERRLSRLTAVG